MLGKNNQAERQRKQSTKVTHYAIKKLTIGVASVAVAGFLLSNGASVSAQEAANAEETTVVLPSEAAEEAPFELPSEATLQPEATVAPAPEAVSEESAIEEVKPAEEVPVAETTKPESKYATREYKASNTTPTDPTNNAMPRPANEGETFATGTGFRVGESKPEGYTVTPPQFPAVLEKYKDKVAGRITTGMAESYITGNILTVSQDEAGEFYVSEFTKDGTLRRSFKATATPQPVNNSQFVSGSNLAIGENYAEAYVITTGSVKTLRINGLFDPEHRTDGAAPNPGNPNRYAVLAKNGIATPAADLSKMNFQGRKVNIQVSEPSAPDFPRVTSKEQKTYHKVLRNGAEFAPVVIQNGREGDSYTTNKAAESPRFDASEFDVVIPSNANGIIWPNTLKDPGSFKEFPLPVLLNGQNVNATLRMELVDASGRIKVTATMPDGTKLKTLMRTDKIIESTNAPKGTFPNPVYRRTNATEGYLYALDAKQAANGRALTSKNFIVYFEQPTESQLATFYRNNGRLEPNETTDVIFMPSLYVKESGDVHYYYTQERAAIKFWDVTTGTDVALNGENGKATIQGGQVNGRPRQILGKSNSPITAAILKERYGVDVAAAVQWYLDNGYEIANDTNGTEGNGQPSNFHGFDVATGEFLNNPTFAPTTASADNINYAGTDQERATAEVARMRDNITIINIRFRKRPEAPVVQNGNVAVNYVIKDTTTTLQPRNQFVSDQPAGTRYNATTEALQPAVIRTGAEGNQKVYKYSSTKTGGTNAPATGTVEANVTKEVTHEYVEAKGNVNVNYVIQGTETVIKDKQSVLANASNDTDYVTDNNQFRPATITGKDDGKLYELVAVRTTGPNDAPKRGKVVADETKEVTYEYRLAKGNVNVNYVIAGTETVIKTKQAVATNQPDGSDYDATTNNFRPQTITATDQKVYEFSKTRTEGTNSAPATGTVTGKQTKEVTHEYVEVKGDVKVNYVIQGTEETLQEQKTAVSQASNNTDYNTNTSALKPETLSKEGKTYELVGVRTTGQNDAPETGKVVARETKYVTYEYREVPTPPAVTTGDVQVKFIRDTDSQEIARVNILKDDAPAGEEYNAGTVRPQEIQFEGKTYVYKEINLNGNAPERGTVEADRTKVVVYVYSLKPETPAAVKQQAVVKYYNKSDNNNLLATSNTVEGDAGAPIQDTAATPDKGNTVEETIEYYKKRGYALVSNGFNPGKENATPVYDNVEGNVQEVPVVLEHTFEEIPPTGKVPNTPIHPDPNTPGGKVPNTPDYPEEADQRHLNKTVKRVIRYWIERENGEKAFEDVEQEVSFTRTAIVNKVTGEFVRYTDWKAADKTLDEEKSPVKDGYTVDRTVVPSLLVDPDNVPEVQDEAGHNYIENVIYRPVPAPVEQRARLVFKQVPSEEASSELDETDIPNVDPETVTGTEGGNIVFPTMAETIRNLEAKGYKVLKDGYANATPADKDFNADPNDVQEFKIVVVPKTSPITPEQPGKPGEPIDPKNPGPKWPNDKGVEDVVRTITRTVSYVKKDSVDATEETEAAPTRSNNVTFTRTGKINHVTGEVTWDAWTPVANDTTLDGSNLPEVPGYKAVTATNTVNNTLLTVTPQSTTEDVTGVTENSKDIVEKVIYVPVKQEAVVKYYDKSKNNELLATSDKVEGTTGNPIQDTAATPEKGNNVEETIKYFTDRGYKVVSNGFNPGNDSETPVYDNVEGNVQEVPVVLEHTFEEIPPTGKVPGTPIHPTPEDPNTPIPGTPTYPEGIAESDLNKTVTRVIRYWIERVDGTKAFEDVEQTVTFTRTAKVNKVTGEVISYSEWMTNDNTLEEKVSPAKDGYTVDRSVVPSRDVAVTVENGTRYVEDVIYTPIAPKEGNVVVRYIDTEGNQIKDPRTDTPNSPVGTAYNTGENPEERPEEIPVDGKRYVRVPSLTQGTEEGTVTEGTTTVTYVYKKVANWIPLIPGQPKEENPRNPYPFDPNKPEDPIKTPPTTPDGTPNVPYVPGYTPNDPNGNPLTPVDPEDPEKGYIPPVPKTPGEDTEIPYVKNQGAVIVHFQDTEGNTIKATVVDTDLTDVGTEYTTTDNRPEEIVVGGTRYVRVPSRTKNADKETGTVVEGLTEITYVYQKVANWIPLIPGEPNPPKNPYPFNPEKPNDPIPTPPNNPGGTPNVPFVPGHTPNDPNGNPLTPVDPEKGYTPPVPNVPGEDTYIPYVPNPTPPAPKQGVVVVHYEDTDGNPIKSSVEDTPLSNVGTEYTTTDNKPEEIVVGESRYVLVPSRTKNADKETGTVVEGKTEITYVYQKVANWIPLIPGEPNPPKNPYPFNPEKPNDPIPTPPNNPGGTPNVPHVPGYIPNGPDGNPLTPVDPEDPNKGYIPPVPTTPDKDTLIPYVPVQEADLTFYVKNPDGSTTAIPTIPVEELKGKDGEPIKFTGYTPNLTELKKKGYEVVEDDYNNRGNFDNDPKVPQHFKVVVTPKITPITPDEPGKPGEPIDPNNPEGPKWPNDKGVNEVKRTINRKIQYVKLDGDDMTELPDFEKNSTVEYTRTGTINHVTGEVTFQDWTATGGKTELEGRTLPFVPGYIATVAYNVKTQEPITLDQTTTGAQTTPDSTDIHEVVVYRKLGSWVPKIPGQPDQPKLPYPNDPKEDPTKPGTPTDPGVPPIPYVPGYVPKVPSDPNDPNSPKVPLTPVDPEDPKKGYIPPKLPNDPGVDTPIPYEKIEEGRVVVEYRDTEGNPLKNPVEDTPLSKVGTSYTTTDNRPEEIIVGGTRYVRVPSLTTGTEEGTVVEGTTTVTYVYQKVANWIPLIPGEPNPPKNPYPFEPNKPNDPIKTPPTNPGGTPNVPYVPGHTPNDPNGNPLVPVDPKDPNKGYIPPVPNKPGEDTYIPYVPNPLPPAPKQGTVVVNYKDTDGNTISSPVVDTPLSTVGTDYDTTDNKPNEFNIGGTRYVLVPSRTEGNETGKVVEGETTITYVYQKVANWIPLIPGEPNPPKNPYPFNPDKPNDPIPAVPEVPGKPGVPVVPFVPEYIPNGPDGNPLVPVDPKDPNKGYIPPAPKVPGEDTYIPYVPAGTVEIEYRDTEGNPLRDPRLDTPLSKVGTSYNTGENPDERPEELTDKDGNRYVRVPSLTQGNEEGKVVQGKTTVVYVYQKVGNWIPLIPGEPNPPKNPYPFNPDKPNDPIPAVPEVPGKPGVPVVPYVPGYTPKDPNGNPLVPVNPEDPSKGYIPPVPAEPGKDTPIPYEKDPQPDPMPTPDPKPTPDPMPTPDPKPTPDKPTPTPEKPQPTPPTPAQPSQPMETLPETGEASAFAAFGVAATSILVGLGLIGAKKREEDAE